MKERPILMTTESVKAILDGRKAQTRRAYGLEKINEDPDAWEFKRINNGGIALFWRKNIMEEDIALCKCPYGQVGDLLWVKETFWHPPIYVDDVKDTSIVCYKANLEPHQAEKQIWKPSIFMPRWASRITLEITGLRAERLQEITEEDALAEGCSPLRCEEENMTEPATIEFEELWDSLNAKRGYGWDKNNWVWPISFKVVK